MPVKKLPLDKLPYWPRLMSLQAAAAYLSLSTATFETRIPVRPIKIGSRKLYDRYVIDEHINQYGINQSNGGWGKTDEELLAMLGEPSSTRSRRSRKA